MAREPQLGLLASELHSFVELFPSAIDELTDFYLKHAHDDYLTALEALPGSRVAAQVNSTLEADALCRRLLLAADQVLLSWAPSPGAGLGFFPVPDSLASPVLGLLTAVDSATGKHRPVEPAEVAWAALASASEDLKQPAGVLGIDWQSGHRCWQRTMSTRTSQPFRNEKGQECRICAGYVHSGPEGLLRWLSQGGFALLTAERVVPAPFLVLEKDPATASAKAALTGSSLCLPPSNLPSAGSNQIADTLGQLTIPYIENVPLDVLVRVLRDEEESLASFRRVLYRALEDIRDAPNTHEARGVFKRLQRQEIEDELRRLKETCARIARRNSLARIGAYVGSGGLAIGALLGLDAAAIACGVSGLAGGAINEGFRYFEDRRMFRRSPLHFLWRLGEEAG